MISDKKKYSCYSAFLGLWLFASFIFGGCASVVAPSGGPKDVSAPKLLNATPADLTTHFADKSIVLSFNEFIQLKDKDKQVVISPIMKPAPQMTVKGKKLIITLKSSLKDSTTYTINFGNAICDLHEGNALTDYSYVFSTGEYVDTLSIKGNVRYAENEKPEKGVLVMLYTSNDDSLPYLSMPSFITRTDDKGDFKINHIGHGPFKIFALKDADNNFKFNSTDEYIAFRTHSVGGGDSSNILLRLFKEEDSKLYVKDSKLLSPLSARVVFNKPSDEQIQPLDSSSRIIRYADYSINRDTVVLWFNDTLRDTVKVIVQNNTIISDTLSFYQKENVSSKKLLEKLTAALLLIGKSVPGETWRFKSSLPLQSINHDKIVLTIDSIQPVSFSDSVSTASLQNFFLKVHSKEKSKYHILFLPGALTSIYSTTNDSISFTVATAAFTDYGSVKIKLSGLKTGKYILQLVDEKDAALAEKNISSDGVYLFENMSPAKCRIKLIDDTDGNGKFTTGNYLKGLQPEHCYYYNETITIRSNWDIETDWKIKIQ